MLTITTEKHILYINIALLKKRLKSAIITLLKVSTTICTIAGIFWIIGTAGQSDLDLITFNQIITRVLQGFFLCGIAYVLNFIKNALQ